MKCSRACLKVGVMPLLLIAVALLGALPARAFEPGYDYWFVETLTPSFVDLPAGVTIGVSTPETSARASLILENQSEKPLYVLSLIYKNVLVMPTPDPNWKARLGMAHEVASYLVTREKTAYLNMESLTDLDQGLIDRNTLSLEPPPTGVTVPGAQSSELLLVYGERVMLVPFTISYALNSQYNNGPGANASMMANAQNTNSASATATSQANDFTARAVRNNIAVIGIGGLIALLIIGWLAWKGLSQQR